MERDILITILVAQILFFVLFLWLVFCYFRQRSDLAKTKLLVKEKEIEKIVDDKSLQDLVDINNSSPKS